MPSEIDNLTAREKEISQKSPWIHGAVAVVCLVLGVVLMVATFAIPSLGGLCGACFGIAAMAFVSRFAVIQEKINLELIHQPESSRRHD